MAQEQRQHDQEDDRARAERTKAEHAEREKFNNPATADQRQYGDQPGLHPANQPTPDTKEHKGTRLDLEDITGNPGHRGVNPDAPAGSINRAPDPKTGRLESLNEPPGVEPGTRRAPSTTSTIAPNPRNADPLATPHSINEPPGSQVVPPVEEPPINEVDPPPETEPLPPESELERMTRAELDELAEKRGVDTGDAATKADVIDALKKAARRSKRA